MSIKQWTYLQTMFYITLFPIADITYTLHKENVNYATAKKNCEAAGLTLAMPTTAAQLKDLKSAVGNQLTGTLYILFTWHDCLTCPQERPPPNIRTSTHPLLCTSHHKPYTPLSLCTSYLWTRHILCSLPPFAAFITFLALPVQTPDYLLFWMMW